MLPLLKGTRILDMSALIPGAMSTHLLADWGAEVIKVEAVPVGDWLREVRSIDRELRIGVPHLMLNRNKKSVSLDLKKQEGREAFYKLLLTADAVFEVSVPGTREKLGVDYERCREVKPDVVYASLTGFGYTGPYARHPSHGGGPEAATGIATPVKLPDGRITIDRPQPRIGDALAGCFGAMSVMSGIIHHSLTGEGCRLETSMADALVWFQNERVFHQYNDIQFRETPIGAGAARYNFYECKDGRYVLLMPIEKKFWIRFCDAIGREDLKSKANWDVGIDFGINYPGLEEEMTAILKTKTAEEWLDVLGDADVPVAPTLSVQELVQQKDYVAARKPTVSYEHPGFGPVTLTSTPLKWPGHDFSVQMPAPRVGEHNEEILGELGYSTEDMERLRKSDVIV